MDKKILMDILDSKEKRAHRQESFIKKYENSLISFTLNIPGRIKDNDLYRDMHREGVKIIEEFLHEKKIPILALSEVENRTGREAYLVVDIDAYKLKQMLIEIEETHPIGRVFDIDIFDKRHNQISRSDLKNLSRRCLLCDRDAKICMRMKNHSYENLIEEISNIWERYKAN